MKNSIAWHERCLLNQEDHLRYKERDLNMFLLEVKSLRSQVKFYQRQISLAKKEGKKTGFDRDKYAIKRILK